MSMNINSVSNSPPNEQNLNVEQQKVMAKDNIDTQRQAQQEAIIEAKEEAIAQQQEEQERLRERLQSLGKYVMSESDMRELLVLMGSKGNTQAIEKMVETVKRAREDTDV